MNFIEFKNKFKEAVLLSKKEIGLNFPKFYDKNLIYWQSKGYIKKVIRGFYLFTDTELNERNLYFISNNIYFPSYIGTYQALNYYGFIPEQVFQITAITTKKTNEFKTIGHTFLYQTVSKKLFWGYEIQKIGKTSFYISDVEKTILDFFYLNKRYKDEEDILGLRFNFDILQEKIDEKKLLRYLKIFNNKTLEKIIFIFLKLLKNA